MMRIEEYEELKRLRNQGEQLKFVREYRQVTQQELCKQITGLSQSNLSRFEKGLVQISEDKKQEIMKYLEWPFEFLDVRLGNLEICG